MKIYYCHLTLHDNVFYASREMGILYETEKYLHNWALTYAFFKSIIIPDLYASVGKKAQQAQYFDRQSEQSLLPLNDREIYIFPAQPVTWTYQINTFKAAQASYYGKSKQFGAKGANRNYPINFGRAKELAVGSQFSTFMIIPDDFNPDQLASWIRVGKWLAKVKVERHPIPEKAISHHTGEYICEHPLNPLDLSSNQQLLLYNRIVMPPVSLISQAQLRGDYYQLKGNELKSLTNKFPHLNKKINLPSGVNYGAGYTIEN